MQTLLETERLILRRFTATDADHLFELDNDPEVMRYINGGTPTPRGVIENNILPNFLRYDAQFPSYGFWAVIAKASGHFLGWISFRPISEGANTVILGYRLHQAAWGKGYASEGVQALVALGFTELGVQRVMATTYEENLASRRVMEKAGLKFERAFRLTEADIMNADTSHTETMDIWDGDDVEYTLDRAAWEQQHNDICH